MYQLGWLLTALLTAIQSSARKLGRYLIIPKLDSINCDNTTKDVWLDATNGQDETMVLTSTN